jgi:hypothetical protein
MGVIMGSTASFSSANLTGFWAPLQGFLTWCITVPLDPAVKLQSVNLRVAAASQSFTASTTKPSRQRPVLGARPMTCFQASTHPSGNAAHRTEPSRLRVLREFEPGVSPACAGRMVISGRMADVCAELERMSMTQRQAH